MQVAEIIKSTSYLATCSSLSTYIHLLRMKIFRLCACIAVAALTAWSMVYRCCGGLWFLSAPLIGTFGAQFGLAVLLAEVVILALAVSSLYLALWMFGAATRRVTGMHSVTQTHVSFFAAVIAAAVAVALAGGISEAVALPSEALAWTLAEAHLRGLQLPGLLKPHHRVQGYGVWRDANRLLGEANVLAWTQPRNVPNLLSATESSAVAELILKERREHFVHTDTQVG